MIISRREVIWYFLAYYSVDFYENFHDDSLKIWKDSGRGFFLNFWIAALVGIYVTLEKLKIFDVGNN